MTDRTEEAGGRSSSAATLGGPRRRTRSATLLPTLAIVLVAALLFGYDVWEAVGNLVGLRDVAAGLGTSLNATGWTVLVAGLVLPILCFAAALLLSRRMRPLARAGVLLVALCLSAVLALDVQLVLGFESLVDLG